jgi:hypothetical protein
MMAYRSTVQESTGCTPNMMMLGREVLTPLELQYPVGQNPKCSYECTTDYTRWLRHILDEAHNMAREKLGRCAVKQKKLYDVGKCERKFHRGQWIYPVEHVKKKLQPKWKEHHLIVREPQVGDVNLTVQLNKNSPRKVIHMNDVKPAYGIVLDSWLTADTPELYIFKKVFQTSSTDEQVRVMELLMKLMVNKTGRLEDDDGNNKEDEKEIELEKEEDNIIQVTEQVEDAIQIHSKEQDILEKLMTKESEMPKETLTEIQENVEEPKTTRSGRLIKSNPKYKDYVVEIED